MPSPVVRIMHNSAPDPMARARNATSGPLGGEIFRAKYTYGARTNAANSRTGAMPMFPVRYQLEQFSRMLWESSRELALNLRMSNAPTGQTTLPSLLYNAFILRPSQNGGRGVRGG